MNTEATAMTQDEYVRLLKRVDWHFMSSRRGGYFRGRDLYRRAQEAAKTLDPTFEVWNQYAPEGHKNGGRT